ncbi:MAG: hypothetical protein IK025_02980 [Bacteroidales bacterium]|nr:hypothetical protein [Bacteroidales bacterium]
MKSPQIREQKSNKFGNEKSISSGVEVGKYLILKNVSYLEYLVVSDFHSDTLEY